MSMNANNPYATQSTKSEGEFEQGSRLKEGLPKSLNVFAILFIVFGTLGILSFPMSFVGLAVQQWMPKPAPGAPDAEYTSKMLDMGKQMMIPAMVLSFFESLLSAGFIYGGIQTLRRRATGLKIGALACFGSFPLEIGRSGLGVYVGFLQQDAFQSFPMGQFKGSPAAPFLELLFNNIIYLTGCMTIGMTLFRFLYYGYAWTVFRNPSHIEFMQPSNPPSPIEIQKEYGNVE